MTIRVRNEKGVILIALLWILTAISVIALSFARETRVEVAAARNNRDLSDAYYVARAGIAATIYRLYQKRFVPRVRRLELEAPPDPIDLGRLTGAFGDGAYEVDIQDESGKINLNTVSEQQLLQLLAAVGINEQDAAVISDSILDWRDADLLHRGNGAEDDYYESLDPPYKAKNGRLDTVEELLLIRGVTPDYFYGHREKSPDGAVVYRYGLSRYCTVYSSRNQVNVNYAPLQVLLSIPGMTPDVAQAIYDRRHEKPFANVQEITKDLPVTLDTSVMPYLSTQQTGVYTLTAWAHRNGSKVRRVIRTVVRLDPRDAKRYRILYWNENVPNL